MRQSESIIHIDFALTEVARNADRLQKGLMAAVKDIFEVNYHDIT
jgi:hypothetical protein